MIDAGMFIHKYMCVTEYDNNKMHVQFLNMLHINSNALVYR